MINKTKSPMETMAGETTTEHVDIMNRRIETFSQQIMANKELAILEAANKVFGKDKWDRANVCGFIQTNKNECYEYKGRKFLTLVPIEFESVEIGCNFKTVVQQKYMIHN